jgi:hypothetical protein
MKIQVEVRFPVKMEASKSSETLVSYRNTTKGKGKVVLVLK